MARYPWFRMYYEARTDAKLHSLPDDQFRVWFNLLCFAAEQDEQRGSIDISDQFIVALEVAGGDEELLSRTCHALSRLKIVTYDEVTLTFINFKPRQYDKPSDEPEKTRERKRKSRETTRDSSTSRRVSRDVTPRHAQDTDTDTDTDTEDKEGAYAPSRVSGNGPSPYPDAFLVFWDAYPRKVGKDDALKAWRQIRPAKSELDDMLAALAAQKRSDDWRKESGRFIPHPGRWLRAGRWKDEHVEVETEERGLVV